MRYLFCLFLFHFFSSSLFGQPNLPNYPTYFQYSQEELSQLASMHSQLEMSKQELFDWDAYLSKLLQSCPLDDSNSSRLLAYLYSAQRDAAFLSFNSHGNFIGSLNALSLGVISFYFKDTKIKHPEIKTDDYTNYLTHIVLSRYRHRFNQENNQIKEYKLNLADLSWKPQGRPFGLTIGSWSPWLIQSNQQFKAPPPPPATDSEFWLNQCQLVKEAQKDLTEQKKEAILFWANEKGPDSGDWFVILNQFLANHPVPLAKCFLVRSVFSEAYSDTLITIFDSKYTYLVRRPFMVDKTIHQEITCPNHPSYPSGHSTTSGLAAELLSYYFPEQRNYWFNLAEQAGLSRIWAGIHFPIDHQTGFLMGEKIAQTIIQMPRNNF